MQISITSLKKSAETLAAKLRKEGYEVTVSPFVDGTRGGTYGGSYVEITVENETTSGGDFFEVYTCYSSYGRTSRRVFSGQDMKWSEMKRRILADIESSKS